MTFDLMQCKPQGRERIRRQEDPLRNRRRTVRIALLGCGTVGQEVARLLSHDRERVERAINAELELTPILVRDVDRNRGIHGVRFTDSLDQILDQEPHIVIEAIGGVEHAALLISEVLKRGISVVSANKSLVAHQGTRLRAVAAKAGAAIRYEACVGAAAPILASLRQLGADHVRSITGVVNGSCNAILSWMLTEGLSRNDAIARAQRQGLVEPDPVADVSGRDSAEKLIVLAHALGHDIVFRQVDCEGIESIQRADLIFAWRARRVIRLIAHLAWNPNGEVNVWVGPRLVRYDSPLGRVTGARNVFVIDADLAGQVVVEGVGAGPRATASAILGDVIAIAQGGRSSVSRAVAQPCNLSRKETPVVSLVRLPRVAGLDPISLEQLFRHAGIEIGELVFEAGAIRLLTRPAVPTLVRRIARQLGGPQALVLDTFDQ